ncbi:MAG: prolyl oligopeptidase family serine peptidase, partial [Gemmatimonadetes bacterium]|nr:prolyl oligopeptidase family serine peptidase [Gemmatimonadota bacterium]
MICLQLSDVGRAIVVTALSTAAAVASALPTRAQEAQEGWTPELSMQYRAIGGTAISPDAGRVAFVVREPLMAGEQSEYRTHVWMADGSGAPAAQWTRGESSASSPRFSPDGRWLSFSSSRDAEDDSDGNQVWALPVAGGEGRQLTAAEGSVGLYRWSPDGTRIAFLMRDPETPEEKKAKREKRDVILVDRDFKYSHLYVVAVRPDAGPAEPMRLTAGAYTINGFTWSPSGDRIAFSHQPDPNLNTSFMSGDISIVTVPAAAEIEATLAARAESEEEDEEEEAPAETSIETVGEVTALLTGAGVERGPVWSPAGDLIAFVSSGAQPEPIGLGDLYVVAADGGSPRRLETPNRSASIIGWSEDGREIFLNEALGTRRHVIAVPVDGGEIRQLSDGDGVVGSVSLTPDGSHMAFTWQTPDEPWDVFVSATDRYVASRISDLHADVPRPDMGRTELLTWTTEDGFEIEGLLTYPVGYRAGERVPLILNVHGGPAGVYSQSFTGSPSIYMLQYFAQQGFAILRPNPRGSTGYGKDFRFANFQDWGYGDFRDLMTGVDRVVEMGVADPNELLLMGWSYGGYMTSWAVTQTDRFRAASMGAGLPNLVSMTTT